MRGAEPKPNSARVETFPRVTRSFQVFVLRLEPCKVFVEGVVVQSVHVVGQLEKNSAR